VTVFTFHFAKINIGTAVGALVRPPAGEGVPGLNQAECMWQMKLGAHILSPARMQLPQVPRFIRWGKPVEELVLDDPAKTVAIAAMRLPRTVSTFSVWRSQREMVDMVRGHTPVPRPKRHIDAMAERKRKDFHFEFTTLRFRPIREYGDWEGRGNIVPM
jgi:hypothetical protein